MAIRISQSKVFSNPAFDTYVPELFESANIQNAFELFYYGNSDLGNGEGDVSLYKTLVDFDTRIDLNNGLFNGHASAIFNVHGILPGSRVVGTTDEMTLTNKTLTSPTITSPSISSPTVTGTATFPSTTSIGNVSSTEIGYLDGVTSAIQTQLNTKAPIANPTFTGTVGGVTKAMVGLGNVDNTSDANKPVSSATQAALDGKSGTGHGHDYAASGHGHSYLPLSGGAVSGNIGANFYYSNVGFQSAGGTIETLGSGPIQTNGIELIGPSVRPRTGNTGGVGSSGQRFNHIFLVHQPDVSSDVRNKSEITESALGLDFINNLNPVSYKVLGDEENRTHYGLIAQEVKQAVDSSGVSDFAGWVGEDESEPNARQSLAYGEFTAPLIKAVQELSLEVEALKNRIVELEAN